MSKNIVTVTIVFLLISAIPFISSSPYYLNLVIAIMINCMLALSLQLVVKTGQVSLGHGGFAACGAYTSALLLMRLHLPFWVSLPLGGIVAASLSFVLGYISLRLRGLYFAITTFAFSQILYQILGSVKRDFFGGFGGLIGIPQPHVTLPEIGRLNATSLGYLYFIGLVILSLIVILCYRLEKTHFGLISEYTAADSMLSESIGINTFEQKLNAFVISGFLAGVAGGFFGLYYTYITPDNFGTWASIDLLIYCVVGGTSTIWGPLIGASVLTIFSEASREVAQYHPLILGTAVVMTMRFMPGGLISIAEFFPKRVLPKAGLSG